MDRVEFYFKLNKILLSLIGLWPYQTSRESRLALGIIFFLTISLLIPQLAGFFKVRHNFDIVIECLPPFGIASLCAIKIINLIINNEKMKDLLMKIQMDFDRAIYPPEITIIKKYGESSRKLSKAYAIILFALSVLFVLPPLLDSSSSKLEEMKSSRRLPFIVDYHIDTDKYFYFIILHVFLSAIAFMTIMISADTIFIVFIQHGCAKFMLLEYRLSQVIQSQELDFANGMYDLDNENHDLVYQRVKICIELHEEAIQFTKAIESTYAICQFFQVIICCLSISIIGLHATTKLGKPDELMRFFGMIFGILLQLLFYSLKSHELMDRSLNVCDFIYNIEWYFASIRTRKLLLQMMTRSLNKCKITAGKLYPMSLENFCKILSNSMSYFTMLSSLQEQSNAEE